MDERDRDRDERDRRWRIWMTAAQAGEAAIYEKLLIELLPFIRRQLASRVRDPGEREDVVQNVLISLHRARHTYRSERLFVPWLRAVVRNASIDWMRARGSRLRHEWSGNVEELAQPSCEAPLPAADELLEREDARAYVRREIERLPESYRTVLVLRDIEEFDTTQTAAILGCTPGSVRVRLHRARLAFREQIETGVPGPVDAARRPRPANPLPLAIR